MLYLAWLLSLVIVGLCSYHYRRVVDEVKFLKTKVTPAKPESKPESATMFDGNDPALLAKYEFEERFKKMNGHIYDDPEQ